MKLLYWYWYMLYLLSRGRDRLVYGKGSIRLDTFVYKVKANKEWSAAYRKAKEKFTNEDKV